MFHGKVLTSLAVLTMILPWIGVRLMIIDSASNCPRLSILVLYSNKWERKKSRCLHFGPLTRSAVWLFLWRNFSQFWFSACSTQETEDGYCCVFPFKFGGIWYYSCTTLGWYREWCGLTNNYDRDGMWGNCIGKMLSFTPVFYAFLPEVV